MSKYGFAIDRGGTFTDVYVRRPDGTSRVLKLLSDDPENYTDAPTEGIRRILEEELQRPFPRNVPIDTEAIGWIRMGTTVATNALLERKGEPMALAITKGFRDLLHIGNQARPKIFDLRIEVPEVLYQEVIEVDERVVLCQESCQLKTGAPLATATTTGDSIEIWQRVNKDDLRRRLLDILQKGICSLAVVLLHSYMYPDHEIEVGKLALELGFTNVSLSSQVMPMLRAVPRGFTACADAYLTPIIQKYINGFTKGFKDALKGVQVLFMQSDGGLCPVDTFYGSRSILSGPAGGVVGVALTSFDETTKVPLIGFDMGGTSTDVSRYAGELEHVFESTTAGITIQAPQLDINTVAAGGGSRLFFRSGLFVVGPESTGANPGPVCYKKGGQLAITDANLVLGRILPEFFPHIFGPEANEPLDTAAALEAFEELTEQVNTFMKQEYPDKRSMSVHEVALGFVDVANEAMCRPIRAITQAKGYDTSRHVLASFGGAGGQHACAIAKALGMKKVLVHRYAGILSAYGLALSDVVSEAQEPCHVAYCEENYRLFDDKLNALAAKAKTVLIGQGFTDNQVTLTPYLNLRYDRTDCALMCTAAACNMSESDKSGATTTTTKHGDFLATFLESYKREFGFTIPNRAVIVDDVRIRAVAKIGILERRSLPQTQQKSPKPAKNLRCFFREGQLETAVHFLNQLTHGHMIEGPAIIVDQNSTILVEPHCTAELTSEGNISIQIGDATPHQIGVDVDAIQLSIFSHRFMSIAEQMGRILQRTAISTNIKERLDFSCALFGPEGGLIANAPHIPVHLGSMQETVRFQIANVGHAMKQGDVYLSNHPGAGGTHLPDLTVITPVYYQNRPKPVFFVASRGHHADIGGLVPGSMPPHSTNIAEEGATFFSFKLVTNGIFQEQALTEALLVEPAKFPGCSGTRNLQDNLSDLKAQIAANQKGINLVCELIDAYGLDVVQAYMTHIQNNAEVVVRDLLRSFAKRELEATGAAYLQASDFMDDGTEIRLRVELNQEKGEAVFDFTGTGAEVFGNWNAPKAVTNAAIIYCIRSMVGQEIPLNQGCLNPITIVLPPGSILLPTASAAVVGGNVLTSQRLVDVILKAFQVCAASQGCMNNVTFGDANVGYYETVAGGHGADRVLWSDHGDHLVCGFQSAVRDCIMDNIGPTWDGRGGIHTHMTNTRITDPEVLERRYPVVLERFELRPDSGGIGLHRGGDGVIRQYLFRRPLTLSILTERRVFAPFGMKGGEQGVRGLNLLQFGGDSGRIVNLGSKKSVNVGAKDRFILQTPGGGGWGLPGSHSLIGQKISASVSGPIRTSGSLHTFHMIQESA